MVLVQRQKIFSWFDTFNIYDEQGNIFFKAKGKLAWGHKLEIYDANDNYVGKIVEKVISFLPKFKFFVGEQEVGYLRKKFSLFKPKFELEYNNWKISGNFFEWNYQVVSDDKLIMTCDKKVISVRDTYRLNITEDKDALLCAMIALSIDIEKCSR